MSTISSRNGDCGTGVQPLGRCQCIFLDRLVHAASEHSITSLVCWPVFPGCHTSFYRAMVRRSRLLRAAVRNVPRPIVGIHSAQAAQRLRNSAGLESSGGIEPPVSPCAWGCACQSTCRSCCSRGLAPAAGIGKRGNGRECASGSCTRITGRMESPGPPSGQRHMDHHLRLVAHRPGCPARGSIYRDRREAAKRKVPRNCHAE